MPLALAQIGGSLAGQTADTSPRGGISLSPSVVMLAGQPGQAHRQTLRLTNHTSRELAFTLEADVVTDRAAARSPRPGTPGSSPPPRFFHEEIVIAQARSER